MNVGRRLVTGGLGPGSPNLQWTERGSTLVDGRTESSLPRVYTCGDLTGLSLLAHTVACEAEVAAYVILGRADTTSYRTTPGVAYTGPEIVEVE